jgi:hypothetical protein
VTPGLEGPSSETGQNRPIFADSRGPTGYRIAVIAWHAPARGGYDFGPELANLRREMSHSTIDEWRTAESSCCDIDSRA